MSLELKVNSNIDSLSEARLHRAFVQVIEDGIRDGSSWLRADRARHDRSGLTSAHIESSVEDLAAEIEGSFGITPVVEKDAGTPTHGRYRHSQAPMFVDGGTSSPIFAARGGVMNNRREGIFQRKSVRGQEGQHFMASAYAIAQASIRASRAIPEALDEMSAQAQAQSLDTEL